MAAPWRETAGDSEMSARDPLMQPGGLWKEGVFEDPIPAGKGKADSISKEAGSAPGGNDDTIAMLLESGFFHRLYY